MKPAQSFVQILCEIARAQGRHVRRVDFEPRGGEIVLTFEFKQGDASGSEQDPSIDRSR